MLVKHATAYRRHRETWGKWVAAWRLFQRRVNICWGLEGPVGYIPLNIHIGLVLKAHCTSTLNSLVLVLLL